MDERIFDVSKPHSTKPDSTGRPIIVGHHPQMPDPMIRDHVPGHPATGDYHNQPSVPVVEPPVSTTKENPDISRAPTADDFMEPAKIKEHPDLSGPKVATPPPQPAPQPTPPVQPLFHQVPGQTHSQPQQQAPWQPDHQLPISSHHGHHDNGGSRRKWPFFVVVLIILVAAAYAVIDSGLVSTSVKLPFHIFPQDKPAPPTSDQVAPAPASSTLPKGFSTYAVTAAELSFTYPTVWGEPAVTTDPGFSKRGGENKSDGTYAVLVNFATNKDVQLAITSSQLLPAVRSSLYYDFQRVCTGTADGKFYKGVLLFATTDGVDTPTTVSCNQGPLTDGTKLSDTSIVQLKTANQDGSALGDLYTLNLAGNDWPVLRVKDSTSANADNIKKLLDSVSI